MEPELRVRFDLEGWSLYFALLERRPGAGASLDSLRRAVGESARETHTLDSLASHPSIAALRRLFRAAGCDPTRYRPSAEALLRRILKGHDLPAIDPLVDINNCLSLSLGVPSCVMAAERVEAPYVLRSGLPGERYESLKGPFNLEGKPVLVDARGPCDAPITGSQRVKITPTTGWAWLVAYLPRGLVEPALAGDTLETLLVRAPVARVSQAAGF